MNHVKKLSEAGAVPKGAKSNLSFCLQNTAFGGNIREGNKLALCDPQTSGGLLISLPPEGIKKFDRLMKKSKVPYCVIGEVVKGSGRIIVQ